MKTDPQKFELRRTIRARRDRVFAAWITPELVRRWFAPGAWSVTRATFDVRVGGGFEIGMRAPQDQQETGVVCGRYEAVVTDELLVFSWNWSGRPEETTLVTVRLSEAIDGVELVLMHEFFHTPESSAAHEAGWRDNLGKLELLAATEEMT